MASKLCFVFVALFVLCQVSDWKQCQTQQKKTQKNVCLFQGCFLGGFGPSWRRSGHQTRCQQSDRRSAEQTQNGFERRFRQITGNIWKRGTACLNMRTIDRYFSFKCRTATSCRIWRAWFRSSAPTSNPKGKPWRRKSKKQGRPTRS